MDSSGRRRRTELSEHVSLETNARNTALDWNGFGRSVSFAALNQCWAVIRVKATKPVSETNNAGKQNFPALSSCGRWVVSGRLKWGYRPVAVVNRAKLEGRTFQTSCCCAIARATRPEPPSQAVILGGRRSRWSQRAPFPGLCLVCCASAFLILVNKCLSERRHIFTLRKRQPSISTNKKILSCQQQNLYQTVKFLFESDLALKSRDSLHDAYS